MHQVDYISRFPGHDPVRRSDADKEMDATLTILGKCFHQAYLPDLIVRHTASKKSQPIPETDRTLRNPEYPSPKPAPKDL